MPTIQSISTQDFRRKLKDGAGSDAVHTDPSYGYGVTLLGTDTGLIGTGIAYTLGDGTNPSARRSDSRRAAAGPRDRGTDGGVWRGATLARRASWRALAWAAQGRDTPRARLHHQRLFRPLGEVTRRTGLETVARPVSGGDHAAVDFSYLEEVLTEAEAVELLQSHQATRAEREGVLKPATPATTLPSVGSVQRREDSDNAKAAVDAGFTAMKLKVGAKDHSHDVRRRSWFARRWAIDVRIMLDANQAWPLRRRSTPASRSRA